MRRVGTVAPGWYPDPSARWQVRWWDGSAWSDHVAANGRQARDPLPAGEDTANLVNRVVACALGFADLADTTPDSLDASTVTTALWRQAATRRDILLLAQGHLAALEQQGTDRSRAKALEAITRALDNPPLMPC